ncbi:MAG: alpha/beta hydrolase [Pseudolabrys sp.]|nr:alpha/beta hydrolase [Pseudolabrys sp.]
MPDLADLFPGYQSHWIDTSAGKLFARSGGSGPPLLLLHGYPQTHVLWHKVAPLLDKSFTLVIVDLPGYGWSAAPHADAAHAPYDKRSMANAMIELMEKFGYARFALAGHDRGGRVAYRMALDHPGRLSKLCTLDIIPTYEMWHGMDYKGAFKVWHWTFLAQAAPLPEMFIEKAPVGYIEWKMASLAKSGDLSSFDPRAMDHYRAFMSDPTRIHATCEDYRAGWSTDRINDEKDRAGQKKITCPMLALWGDKGIPSDRASPLDTWKRWATDVRGNPIDSGHYLPEENPQATADAMLEFFR